MPILTAQPELVNFKALPLAEKKKVIDAALSGCADQWGEECMIAADAGDKGLYSVSEIRDWISSLDLSF